MVFEIGPEEIKLTKNAPPTPDIVQIEVNEGETQKNYLNSIVFKYWNNSDNRGGEKLMEWIRQYSHGFATGYRFTKEQLVFDGEFMVDGKILYVYNMLLNDADFGDLEDGFSHLTLVLSYEHFYWVI